MNKLHLGCGNKFLKGYKHVDLLDLPHIDYKTSIDDLSMIENESIDEIYACHVLEHTGRLKIDSTLKEWNRVLKKEGILRIAVPNFEAVVEEYLENKNLEKVLGLLYGGQNYSYNFHYVTFDLKKLQNHLEKNGFKNIKKYEWKEFLPENFDDYSRAYLPHLDENGRLMSLNVIAIKG